MREKLVQRGQTRRQANIDKSTLGYWIRQRVIVIVESCKPKQLKFTSRDLSKTQVALYMNNLLQLCFPNCEYHIQ